MNRAIGRRLLLAGLLLSLGACSRSTDDWIADVDHPDEVYRLMAVVALRQVDAREVPIAVETLLDATRDRKGEVSRAATESLVVLGDEALAVLIERLADPSIDVTRKRDIAPVLTAFGSERPDAERLTPMFEAAERIPAEQAYLLSAAIAAIGAPALPPLVERLEAPSAASRAFAASTITQMGTAAREARKPLLARLAKERDATVRLWLARAVARVAPLDDVARRQMSELLGDDESPAVRKTALLALVPHHLARLDDPSATVRQHSSRALERFGDSALPAYLEILRTGEDTDESRWSDPEWIVERLKDPQFGAAMRAVRVRVDTGAWPESPEEGSGFDPVLAEELAGLLEARTRMFRQIARIERRIGVIEQASDEETAAAAADAIDLIPDGAEIEGGRLIVRDADGAVVAELVIESGDLERWLIDAGVRRADDAAAGVN